MIDRSKVQQFKRSRSKPEVLTLNLERLLILQVQQRARILVREALETFRIRQAGYAVKGLA